MSQKSSLPQAAKSVSQVLMSDTIKEARARGELRILQLSRRRIGIKLSDFNAWLESRAV